MEETVASKHLPHAGSFCALPEVLRLIYNPQIVCGVAPATRMRPYMVDVVFLGIERLTLQVPRGYRSPCGARHITTSLSALPSNEGDKRDAG